MLQSAPPPSSLVNLYFISQKFCRAVFSMWPFFSFLYIIYSLCIHLSYLSLPTFTCLPISPCFSVPFHLLSSLSLLISSSPLLSLPHSISHVFTLFLLPSLHFNPLYSPLSSQCISFCRFLFLHFTFVLPHSPPPPASKSFAKQDILPIIHHHLATDKERKIHRKKERGREREWQRDRKRWRDSDR